MDPRRDRPTPEAMNAMQKYDHYSFGAYRNGRRNMPPM
jgi:hypothetical protein